MKGKFIINHFNKIISVITLIMISVCVNAQPVSIDRGIRVNGLWCFPLVSDSLRWLYLPDRGMLASDDNNRPQFSFIRYVNSPEKPTDTESSITKGTGGAVLHFLITYDTDEKKIAGATAKLKELLGDNVKISGPVIFKEGRYALVSSIISQENGTEEKKLMSVGAAPVLQGSKIALSFEIDQDRAKLLLESFKMPTPDVSIVFDMTFSGLMDAYKAKLTVDWTQVNKAEKMGGGFNFYYVSADLEKVYEELRRTSAISLETQGEDDKMQKIVDASYSKLIDMMFQKIEPEELPANEQNGLEGLLNNFLSNKAKGDFSSGKLFSFGAHAVYKKKNIKTSGYSVLNFNSRSSTERHHYITFNIGDFYKKYGQGDDYIKEVSMENSLLQNRNIAVGVDGSLLPEFDKLINNVTVTLRKKHEDGTITIKEVNITSQILSKGNNIFLTYGSISDADRFAWLNYEYNTQFSFKGGKMWQSGWKEQNAAMINLITPYERRVIQIEADADSLNIKNVRAVTVKVEYPFFDGIKTYEVTVKPGEDLSKKQFDITLPVGQYAYKYAIRWQLKNGTIKNETGESETGIIFIDNVPAI